MSDFPEALNEVRLRIEEWFEANEIMFQSRNRRIEVPVGKTWARLTNLGVNSKSACLGQKHIRDRGILVVSIFFPLGSGVAASDKICYSFRDAFSEWTYNHFETGSGEVVEVPSTQDAFHVNVNLPYRHN